MSVFSLPSAIRANYKKAVLAVILGSFAAASLVTDFVAGHEGEVLKSYKDPVGVWTACYGDTDPAIAIPGATYTREDCLESLLNQLVNHAAPVVGCTPAVRHSPEIAAAFTSLAYNIGTGAFCKSTVARRFNAGDYAGACAAIEMWNKAGGKVLKGLVRRRADERKLCEKGIPAMAEKL